MTCPGHAVSAGCQGNNGPPSNCARANAAFIRYCDIPIAGCIRVIYKAVIDDNQSGRKAYLLRRKRPAVLLTLSPENIRAGSSAILLKCNAARIDSAGQGHYLEPLPEVKPCRAPSVTSA